MLMRLNGVAAFVVGAGLALTPSASAPSASDLPSGLIAYAAFKSEVHAPGIYVVRPGRGSPRPLRGRFFQGTRPAWSPDGSKLAFERWETYGECCASRLGWDIVVAATDGTRAHVIVPKTFRLSYPTRPRWSRDGRLIYYMNSGPNERARGYVIPAAGGMPRPSRQPSTAIRAPSGEYEAWIRPGTVLVRHRRTGKLSVVARICRPTNGMGGPHFAPAWSPDSRWLAFADCAASSDGAMGLIVIARIDGSRRTVVARGLDLSAPTWRA
jgi:Tol biopolymer transport system component